MHVGGIFCDLTKASDFINHEMLLAKLPISVEFEENPNIGSGPI